MKKCPARAHFNAAYLAGASPVSRLPCCVARHAAADPGKCGGSPKKLLDLIGGDVTEKTVTEKDDDGNAVSELKRPSRVACSRGERERPCDG